MASDEGSSTPDERQRNLASLNLREMAGELSLLAHAAATGGDYDAEVECPYRCSSHYWEGGREWCGAQFARDAQDGGTECVVYSEAHHKLCCMT
eukprot:6181713-Pleurochrysis_carterae.AAC.2